MNTPESQKVQFGVFEVDLATGELRKAGTKVKLQDQPFQILSALLERPGEIVSREDLRQKIWRDDTFIDFDQGLSKAVNKIREALGDSADSPRFVETIARRGYRFVADVSVDEPVLPSMPAVAPGTAPTGRSWVLPAVLIGAFVVSLVVWRVHSGSGAPAPIRSLAVLPLESLSGDASQDYFADGRT